MVRGSLRLGLEVIGTLVAGLVIVAGFTAYRFSEGRPFHLQFLVPYIERALTPPGGDVRIKLDDLVIAWTGGERLIGLRATHVRAVANDGRVLASVPQIGINLSLRGLLRGLVAPTDIEIYNPHLHLRRDKDGHFQFLTAGDAREGQPTSFIPHALEGLMGEPNLNSAMGYLRRAHLVGGTLDFDDERTGLDWHAPKIDIELLRDRQGMRGSMSAQIAELGDPALFDADFVYDAKGGDITLDGKFNGLDISSLGLLAPDLAALAGSHLQFNGTVGTKLNINGTLGAVHFSLGGGPGTIDLPSRFPKPLPIASLALVGQVESGHDSLVVEEFTVDLGGPLISAEAKLVGLASYHVPKIGRLRVTGKARAVNVPVKSLPDLWPLSAEGHDGARDWVVENMDDGMVEKVEANLDVAFAGGDLDLPQVMSFGGSLKARDLGLYFFRPLPPIRGAKGTATFDATKFTADFSQAAVGKVVATSGHLAITGLDKIDQNIAVEGEVAGPMRDVLQLLDHPPLGYPSKMKLDPATTAGTVSAHLQVQLPAKNHIRDDELHISANAKIQQARFANVVMHHDLTDGNFELKIDTHSMLAVGQAKIAGIPAALHWQSFFGKAVEFHNRITLAADTTAAELSTLGFDYRSLLNGPMHLDLTYTEPVKGLNEVALDFDLTKATATIDLAKWHKPANAPGRASIRLSLQGEHPVAITDFRFEASDLSGNGDARFDAAGKLVHAGFRHLTLAKTRLENLALDFAGEQINVRIGGGEFDAQPFLGKTSLSDQSTPEEGKPGRPYTVVADHLDRIVIGPDREIDNVRFTFDNDGLHWRKLDANGTPRGGQPMAFSWLPSANGTHQLSITAADAGSALKFLGVIGDVVGGKLTITGTASDSDPKRAIKGHVEVSEYRLVNQGALVRLLTIATLTGVIDAMTGSGFQMYRFEGDFTMTGGRIDVPLARTWGPSLGLTATGYIDYAVDQINVRGTVVPAYALNSILSEIPIVGFLLTGSKGGGMFAVVYSATGKLSEPTISVNPFSALTPGFLRGVFGLFPDGDQTQPTALPPNYGQTGSGK